MTLLSDDGVSGLRQEVFIVKSVRSSDSHFVKTSGLRWLSLMLLVDIPWAHRVWALPFFTILAPSQRHHKSRGHRHKNITDWARQMLTQVRRWLPHRAIVLVADSSFAALELLEALRQLSTPVHVVTRLRLDAALYHPAPERQAKQMGRPRICWQTAAHSQIIGR